VVALLLAAGRSTRMQGHNKLLLPLGGQPLVTHAARALARSAVTGVIAVTGHDRGSVERTLEGESLTRVHNPAYETGMASSLKVGLAAIPGDADGVLVCLGDMPAVRPVDIDRLIAAFDPAAGHDIIVPVFGGKRGNPVLLARRFFPDILRCEGDTGARQVVAANPDAVFEVEMETASILADADTPAAFEALKAELDQA
jgi:molybdenum cofactor cytidylyltransferase